MLLTSHHISYILNFTYGANKSNLLTLLLKRHNSTAIREKNVGTFSAVVGQMFPPLPQINVGRRDVFSRQAHGPNIEWCGEWGDDR